MKKNLSLLILLLIICFSARSVSINGDWRPPDSIRYRNSLDFCPLSPIIGIYALHYGYRFNYRSEVILSPSYMRIKYPSIGNTNAPGIIAGYRRYIWRNLHLDYQLMPMWDKFYDKNEDKTYPLSFDLWNEFRLGYAFDFHIKNLPCFFNLQIPLGFILYSDPDGKSEAFKERAEENPIFCIPLFFVGIRFQADKK